MGALLKKVSGLLTKTGHNMFTTVRPERKLSDTNVAFRRVQSWARARCRPKLFYGQKRPYTNPLRAVKHPAWAERQQRRAFERSIQLRNERPQA